MRVPRGAMVWLWLLAAPLVLGLVFGAGTLMLGLGLGLPLDSLAVHVVRWGPWLALPAFGLVGALTLKIASAEGLSPRELGLSRPTHRSLLAATVLTAVVFVANHALFHPLLLRFQPGFDPTGGQVPMALLATMMAVACFAEDLLYRGYAFVALQRRHGVAVAALVTSLGYALLTPGPELPLKIWAFGFGIVLAALRQRTESLWPVVGLHYATSLLPRLALEWGG